MAVDDGAGEGTGVSAGESLPTDSLPADSGPGDPDDLEPAGSQGIESPPARPATDWERYGHRPAVPSAPRTSLQPDVVVGRRGRPEPREDLYADYRREGRSTGLWRERRPSRRRANLAGVGLVLAVAVIFVVAGIVATENAKSVKTPAPTASPTAAPVATTAISVAPTAIPAIVGPSAMVLDLPSAVETPDRSMPQDDGGMLYLGGATAGLQINTQTGEIKSRSGAYGKSIGRQVVAGGSVWRSTSWGPSDICDRACWGRSTTYRVDAATGKVQTKYDATYLVGYDSGGIWIAGIAKGLQMLDPGTGAVVVTVPWKTGAEPRVGCGGLWSVSSAGQGDYVLRKVNATTGTLIGQDNQFATFFYGPVQVHGHCWTMGNGVAGAAVPPTGFAIIGSTDGMTTAMFNPSSPVVILDGEFWAYEPGGILQRFDPSIGRYGSQVQLGVVPVIDSPFALFSSMHKLWAIDGQRLIGYDITTGAVGTGS